MIHLNDSITDWLPLGTAKDYHLNGYPTLPNGKPAHLDFSDYISWLADYLVEPPREEDDTHLVALEPLLRLAPDTAFRVLGGRAGHDAAECETRPFYRYPDNYDPDGEPVELLPIHPDDEVLGDPTDLDPETHRAFVAEDFAFHERHQRELENFQDHWPHFIKQWDISGETQEGEIGEPPDAGWRPFLAALLRRESEKSRRKALLEIFFAEYADAALD
jgi:hypothetical protein